MSLSVLSSKKTLSIDFRLQWNKTLQFCDAIRFYSTKWLCERVGELVFAAYTLEVDFSSGNICLLGWFMNVFRDVLIDLLLSMQLVIAFCSVFPCISENSRDGEMSYFNKL